MGVESGDRHWVGFIRYDSVGRPIDHRVDAKGEDVLVYGPVSVVAKTVGLRCTYGG